MYPLMIRLVWQNLADDFGPFGAFMAAMFVAGTFWVINHGLETPLIHQTGLWVDMGLAAGIGVLTADVLGEKSLKKALPNIAAALTGGFFAGYVLSIIL